MHDMLLDLRYALRSLAAAPGTTFVVLATLALGIGATTAIFSVANAVLLRPLPYPEPERLAMIYQQDRITGTEREPSSVPDWYDLRARSRSFGAIGAFQSRPATLARDGAEPARVTAVSASSGLFAALGVTARAGRLYDAAEDRPGGPQVALLAEGFWRTDFAADARVVGRTVRLDDETFTIVGVVAAGAALPGPEPELWTPLALGPATTPRSLHNVLLLGRLAPGVTLDDARRETGALGAALEAENPQTNRGRGFAVEPLHEVLAGGLRPALLVLLGAVALLLLAACANAANLVLARGWGRSREVAIRSALGASGARIGRQFFAEGLLTAIGAAILGALVALWGLDALSGLAPAELQVRDLAPDWRVLTTTLAVTVLITLALGTAPTLQARRSGLAHLAAAGAQERRRTRDALVVAQVAVSVVLLVGAGLLGRSFVELVGVDPGFRTENVMKLDLQLPRGRYPQRFDVHPRWPEVTGFYDRLLARVEALPGVRSAAIAANHPLAPGFTNSFVIEGRESEYESQPEIAVRAASPGYFQTVGVPLRRGRLLDGRDAAGAPDVVLINEAAAARFFAGREPVGQRISFWGRTREIVGVVGNERFHGLAEAAPPAMYPPLAQAPIGAASVLVRAGGPAEPLGNALREAVRGIDPALAVFDVEMLDRTLAESVARPRFTTVLLGVFAGVTLLLAVLGLYGLLSYAVAQRTRELGIRLALGAPALRVLAAVVARGLALALVGAALGILGSLLLGGTLRGLLFGVRPADPLVLVAAPVFLLLVAGVASYLPARRATGVDPMIALRTD
ncbi:MAG TPA: ABC transporter permease [Gemmatimonadales bacterium]|nr:ABC transporter permease [Gemmatimonadales bacterium]